MKQKRRSLLKRLFAPIGYVTASVRPPEFVTNPVAQVGVLPDDVPLYTSATRLGNLLFIFGIGAHFEGDVRAHTDHVLKELEKELIKAGSSMQKVLKVNVLLHDPNDYGAMNEVYRGRFGPNPPVRTTVGVRSGIPNGSLVEIDCIAHV